MKVILVLFAFCVCFVSTSVQACRTLIQSEEEAQKIIDDAYFVGLVKGEYIQQYPSGNLKEAGFKAFAVYSTSSEANLRGTIVVTGEDQSTSCDADIPNRWELAEVMIVKQNGYLKLKRIDFVTPEFMNKLRQKMRYVGAE